ncbi:class I SAM-dependent methyltransferase [Paenibacillus humicola]|uniref:class I SAM-dependent methyltransferase n=1 Tax=Paenibacillus humicola TaxID=3110540 RepID=UPI00237BBB6A|nr:methyltransferase domain-containing protein [Paenibacillus humicola]
MEIICCEECYVCGELASFVIVPGATLLREANCQYCTASIRYSDTARIISGIFSRQDRPLAESVGSLHGIAILESQSDGPIHEVLHGLQGYTCFEYFDGIKPGEYKDGILCNDFQNLSFADNQFDLVISQDVFEHIARPDKAFREIHRVLKPGGYHVFTVPVHEGRSSLSRAGLPRVYHGDPLREEGALVHTDWGDDIDSIADAYGMTTTRFDLHCFHSIDEITNADRTYSDYLQKKPIEYFQYNSVVFASKKRTDT